MNTKEEQVYQQVLKEAWNKGELEYLLRDHQRKMYLQIMEFMARPQRGNLKYVANCSRRFGKTFTMFLIALMMILRSPTSIVRFAAPSKEQLRQIILPMFRSIVSDSPAGMKPIFRGQDSSIVYREGLPGESRIVIAGCDDSESIERLRGTGADLAIITEAGSIKQLEYITKDILMPQLLDTGGKLLIDSTPPPDSGHYFNVLCDEAILQKNYSEYTIDDNTFLSKETKEAFIEELGGIHSTTVQRELYCRRIADSKRSIIPNWNKRGVKVERPDYFDSCHKYASIDIGGKNDRTVILFGYYDFKKAVLYIEAEIGIAPEDTTTENIAKQYYETKERLGYGEMYGQPGDTNNAILFRDLSTQYNISFYPTSKDTLQAMVNKVREWVPRIEVSEDCPELLGCLVSGSWTADRSKWGSHPVFGHYDALAALMYMVRNIDEVSMPKEVKRSFTDEVFFDPTNKNDEEWLTRLLNLYE